MALWINSGRLPLSHPSRANTTRKQAQGKGKGAATPTTSTTPFTTPTTHIQRINESHHSTQTQRPILSYRQVRLFLSSLVNDE